MISVILVLFNLLVTKGANLMYCDIKGNVKNPGVYEVIEGEVINDIILKAGGLKKNSYVKNINLSKKVEDQMVINILSIDEYEELVYECPVCICKEQVICKEETTTNKTSKLLKTTTLHTSSITSNKIIQTKTNDFTTTTKLITSEVTTNFQDEQLIVNLNYASLNELMKIPGIGQVIAVRIIEYRNIKFFESIEEIKNVKGIGNALFEKIKEFITI